MARERADKLLLERGLVESRAKAQALIMAGKVYSADRHIQPGNRAKARSRAGRGA